MTKKRDLADAEDLVLMEPADVGRVLNLSSDAVRSIAQSGLLKVAARTVRGGRLFRAKDVAELVRSRNRRAGLASPMNEQVEADTYGTR